MSNNENNINTENDTSNSVNNTETITETNSHNLLSCCICTSNEFDRLIRLHTCVDSLLCNTCFLRYNEQGSIHCPICRTELGYKKKYLVHPLFNLFKNYLYVPTYIVVSILLLLITDYSLVVAHNKIEISILTATTTTITTTTNTLSSVMVNSSYESDNVNRLSSSEKLVMNLYKSRSLYILIFVLLKFPIYYLINTTIVYIGRYVNPAKFLGGIYNSVYITFDFIIFISIVIMDMTSYVNMIYYYILIIYVGIFIGISLMSTVINIASKIKIYYDNAKYVIVYDEIGLINNTNRNIAPNIYIDIC